MRISVVLLTCLVAGGCEAPPRLATHVDVKQMEQMLDRPHLSPEEWQDYCATPALDGQSSHCSIAVQIDCPPDCGVYQLVYEDRLARRMW